MFVNLMKEVEKWGQECYEGLMVSPNSEELEYKMMQLKREWGVCWREIVRYF